MSQDDGILGDRRKALEEAFFQKQNAKLKERMRAAQDRDKIVAELRAAFPNATDEVVSHFADQGLDVEAVSALGLVPSVLVAWADGAVGEREREKILAAAHEAGLQVGGRPYTLLAGWLAERPSDSLMELWSRYVATVSHALSPADRDELRDRALAVARGVAEATGGFLGMGKVSPAEEAVMRRIEQAFRG